MLSVDDVLIKIKYCTQVEEIEKERTTNGLSKLSSIVIIIVHASTMDVPSIFYAFPCFFLAFPTIGDAISSHCPALECMACPRNAMWALTFDVS